MLDARYWILDAGCWIQAAGSRMQDSRCTMYYLTSIEILFIKVVSCIFISHFLSIQNPHSKIRNMKILYLVSVSCFVFLIFNQKIVLSANRYLTPLGSGTSGKPPG